MDYGAQFTEREKEAMQVEARKELEEEGELKRLTTEVEEAVAAQVKAEAEVAALEDAELAADVGAELEPLDDEGYFSDEETGAKAVATAEDGADENDSLDGAPITDGLITPGSTVSYPPTPLDSPLASIEEDLEDEGFVDSDSIPEITPEGSTDEIQTGSELDESLIGPLPYDDDGMSAEDIEKQDQKMRRRMVKLELKALAEREEREMKEAAGKSVSTGNEVDPPDDSNADTVSTGEPTPPTSSVPTPPTSTTSTENADVDAVSTSDPTPPVSPVPTPEPSTVSTEDPGPFASQDTDRRALRNSAAKRVMAALFPTEDQESDSKIAGKDADELIKAGALAVEERRFPIEDAKKAKDLAGAHRRMTVNENFFLELGDACAEIARADVGASLESRPPGSIIERIVKQMKVNGSSVAGDQLGQSI